jgi:hypothetical protein
MKRPWKDRLHPAAAATSLLVQNGSMVGSPAPEPQERSAAAESPPARARRPAMRTYLRMLFLLTAAPLVLLAGILSLNTGLNERATVQRGMTDVARALSSAIDGEVGRTQLSLRMLAQARAFDDADWPLLRTMAETLRDAHGSISNIAVFSVDGEPIINLRVANGRPPAPVSSEFILAAKEGRAFTSNVFTSSTSGKKAVSVSAPVVRGGKARYVVAATMEYDLWTDWLRRRTPEGSIAAVDDREGVIFARSNRPEAFVGRTASDPLRRAL